jgi:hypothetical protein
MKEDEEELGHFIEAFLPESLKEYLSPESLTPLSPGADIPAVCRGCKKSLYVWRL